jgi:transposase
MARDFEGMRQRRLRAARLFEQGATQAEVARRLKVSRQSAMVWERAFRKAGRPEGLAPIRRELRRGQRLLHRHPDRILGFLHKAGLFL